MFVAVNAIFFTLLLFCAYMALAQWRVTRDAAVPWYIVYLAATFLHYGRQFWIDVSARPGVPPIPDLPLEWDTPLSYVAFAGYFLFVREMLAAGGSAAPRLLAALRALGRFLGAMSAGHLVVQGVFGHAAADAAHQIAQVALLPVLLWLTVGALRGARLFYQKLVLAGTAALILGFLCVVALRRWPDDYVLVPDVLCCFPTRWGDFCLYHLKVGVALDVLCFSWAIALRHNLLLLEMRPAALLPTTYSDTPPPEHNPAPEALPERQSPLLLKIDEFLSEHYLIPGLRITDIAAGICLSASHLNRLLKAQTGLTTEQYLLRYRLERAKEMLLAGEVSVSSAADAAGFSEVAHFSRAFKKRYGCSPREVRKPKT